MRLMLNVVIVVLLLCLSAPWAQAQNCKPDISRKDKISNEQHDIWFQDLFTTSFVSSTVFSSEESIRVVAGRYGTFSAISLEIQKKVLPEAYSAFDSQYRGAVGRPIQFGFKSGPGVSLIVTDVSNNAKVQQGIMTSAGVTTVVLSTVVSDSDLATLRDTLTTKPITAVRVSLAGDLLMQKDVSDKNGEKMRQKFSCFYEALDKSGTNLRAGVDRRSQPLPIADDGAVAAAQGKYLKKGKNADYFDLRPDGTFMLVLDGKSISGEYTIKGAVLTVVTATPKLTEDLGIVGDTITSKQGTVWERQRTAGPPARSANPLTLEQIVQMVAAKIPDDVIISSIEKSGVKFDLSPENLIKLKGAGASDAVLRAISK